MASAYIDEITEDIRNTFNERVRDLPLDEAIEIGEACVSELEMELEALKESR